MSSSLLEWNSIRQDKCGFIFGFSVRKTVLIWCVACVCVSMVYSHLPERCTKCKPKMMHLVNYTHGQVFIMNESKWGRHILFLLIEKMRKLKLKDDNDSFASFWCKNNLNRSRTLHTEKELRMTEKERRRERESEIGRRKKRTESPRIRTCLF